MSVPPKAIEVKQYRVALRSMGYLLCKVHTADKVPAEPNWHQPTKSRSVQEWEADQTSDQTLNTGMVTHGLRVIDIDLDNPTLANAVVQVCKELLGNAPRRGRENSGRCALLYRSDKSAPKKMQIQGTVGAVEALGNGQQFVCHGLHASGVPYTWDADLRQIPRDSLTTVSDDQIERFFQAIHEQLGAPSPYSKVKVEIPLPAQLMQIPVATAREREYASAALRGEVEKLSALRAGSGRNNALNLAAHAIGTMIAAGWIDREEAGHALLGAAYANGYVAKRGEDAAKKTIISGLSAGYAKPRGPLPDPDSSEHIDISHLSINGVHIDDVLTALGIVQAQPQGKRDGSQVPKRTVVLTGLAGVQEAAVEWHWPGYLPAGMLTLLCGAGGTGKSTLAFGLAATVTKGGHWPDGQPCAGRGNVLIWSSEDDVARTIKPRLMAAGADVNRVAVVESTADCDGIRHPFDPATDIAALRTAVHKAGGVALLIIDPIVSAVSGDMHKANDVRRSLQPIVDFASEFNCAVLGITHFAKNTGGKNASERVIGSQAFAALARMVLATAKEENSDQRVFTRAKSNISADDGGLHYTIEQVSVQSHIGKPIPTTRVAWGEAIQGSAREILSSVEGEDAGHSSKKSDEAKGFLATVLADGPVSVAKVKMQARSLGIASVTLQRAKEAMNVVSVKSKGDFTGAWDWTLPMQQLPKPAELL